MLSAEASMGVSLRSRQTLKRTVRRSFWESIAAGTAVRTEDVKAVGAVRRGLGELAVRVAHPEVNGSLRPRTPERPRVLRRVRDRTTGSTRSRSTSRRSPAGRTCRPGTQPSVPARVRESPYSYLIPSDRAGHGAAPTGRLSVTEVCFAVGSSSLGTFSTRFTELVGVPPSVYRQAAASTEGIPPCVAKQVTRPVRNREATAPGPQPG